MNSEIFIIGLNEIGLSINLALKEGNANLICTGYDADAKLARTARERGDIERIVFSPNKSAQTADMIFLAVSPSDVANYLETLAPLMKPEAILIDLCSLKVKAYQWALESFPQGRYYLGAIPVLNPDLLDSTDTESLLPRPDLFKGGTFALSIPPNTPEKVINVFLGIVNFLGAEPFFIDPHELDGSMAMVEGLPILSSLALLHVVSKATGWRELQRLIGRTWATAAHVGVEKPSKEMAASLLLNKDNLVYKLNALIEELEVIHSMINEGDEKALTSHVEEASSTYQAWIARRKQGNWQMADEKPLSIPKIGILDRLLGTGDYMRKKDKS